MKSFCSQPIQKQSRVTFPLRGTCKNQNINAIQNSKTPILRRLQSTPIPHRLQSKMRQCGKLMYSDHKASRNEKGNDEESERIHFLLKK